MTSSNGTKGEGRPCVPLGSQILGEAIDGGYLDEIWVASDIQTIIDRSLEDMEFPVTETEIVRVVGRVVNESGIVKRMRNRLVKQVATAFADNLYEGTQLVVEE